VEEGSAWKGLRMEEMAGRDLDSSAPNPKGVGKELERCRKNPTLIWRCAPGSPWRARQVTALVKQLRRWISTFSWCPVSVPSHSVEGKPTESAGGE
jgi:hypothetical protein